MELSLLRLHLPSQPLHFILSPFALLFHSPQTSLEAPSMRLLHQPSIFRSIIFLFPSLISHPSCHSSSLPPSLRLPAPSWGPCAGGAITEGGIDSFALMWFGLRCDTAQSDTFSRRTESSCTPPALHVFPNRPINTTQLGSPPFLPLSASHHRAL